MRGVRSLPWPILPVHAVALSSGTAALHLALRATGVRDGDEVVTSPFSFVASANVIAYERATPVFADIDPVTLNLDPEDVAAKITERTGCSVSRTDVTTAGRRGRGTQAFGHRGELGSAVRG